ncbi:type II secretion system secretin GspD [Collimonas sp. OK412]|jgi:general secretion pathway protein D|uniref:type II secretion system secretin GspD n=1 Tax=Collimonas sp. (strain OK412) TaxID=1801619 RepID=UPI0008E15AA3|nr:type II secretion system secretin GspD [Collimonas sp. OK412]SFC15799.1 type II secretion system protein D (GspD) [Collimonas sp. OK412]
MKDKMYSALLSSTCNWRSAAAIALLTCATAVAAQPVLGTSGTATEGASGQAVMNFVGADIESVIKAVGQYTNTTFIVDPRVKGSINLVSEKPLSKTQAFDLLASTLRLQGYAVVRGDGFVKVVPEADAKLQVAPTRPASVRGDQIATQIFSLNYESATNILPVLRPLISPNNTINANPGNNTLVVTDYAENLQRLGKMIAALDVPAVNDLDVIPVRYAVASDIAVMASKLLDSGSAAPGASDSARTMIMADSRTNSVVVRAPSAGRANLAKSLIAKLDQPTANAGNVHVVYLKNADAVKLAKTLRAIVSQDTSMSNISQAKSSSSSSGGMLQGSSGSSALGSNNNSTAPSTPSSPSSDSASQSSGSGSGAAGFIQADDSTNTLIITASEPVYRNIRGVIDQLDQRRAQVYVEALIVEVTDSAASEIGVQWLALSGDSNSNYRVGGGTGFTGTNTGITSGNLFNTAIGQAINTGTTTSVPTVGSGLQLGIFRQIAGKIGLGALASALNSTTGSNVLSMPNLLTLDNEEAKIIVGQNVPFVTGSTLTTGAGTSSPFTTIERKDVGTALKIKPHISEGGTVRLEISQEVSAVVAGTAGATNGPTTTKRSLDTNVVIDDGEIIALGGLIGDNNQNGVQKVPLLGDLPFIGNLFKYQSGSREKTNLMIFLRPIIVRDKDTSNLLAVDRYDYMRKQQIKVQPDKSILTDFGSSVTSKLEDGGPFIDLRKQAVPDGQHQPALEQPQPQLQMPKPATVPAPGLLNDRAP